MYIDAYLGQLMLLRIRQGGKQMRWLSECSFSDFGTFKTMLLFLSRYYP